MSKNIKIIIGIVILLIIAAGGYFLFSKTKTKENNIPNKVINEITDSKKQAEEPNSENLDKIAYESELCDENGVRYKNEKQAKEAGLNE